MSSLVCKGLSKSFGAVRALQNVCLAVQSGETRAILGGNGSGKSTLAKILGGTVFADAGEIVFDGRPLAISSPVFAKRTGIIVTSQELSMMSNLSVEENLLLCGIPRRGIFTDRRRMRREAMATLERVGLERYAQRGIATLAPNQLYLLELAKALSQKPKILVIDEITSALYREDVALVKDAVAGLKAAGCGTLFISHRMSEIFDICDTVTVLRNGENAGDRSLAEADEDGLLTMMSGQDVQKVTQKSRSYEVSGDKGGHFVSVRDLRI